MDLRPTVETDLPLYYFDTDDGEAIRDEEGLECADFEAARSMAMTSLAEIARWATPTSSARQTITAVIRDEAGRLVYTTTLTFDERRLGPETDRSAE